jgi:hypothetical protein
VTDATTAVNEKVMRFECVGMRADTRNMRMHKAFLASPPENCTTDGEG